MTTDPHRSLLEETKVGGPTEPLWVSLDVMSKLDQGDKDSVLSAIQNAIELEHSTIPPYLYALYSLDETKNPDITSIIQSVVVEEMLHMTLACNILNALGGTPNIDTPTFIPTYPGTLPGIDPPDSNPNWRVDLNPCSKDVVQNIFMQIEMPEEPQDFPVLSADALGVEKAQPRTVGTFYRRLKAQIEHMSFVSPPRNQVGPDIMEGSVVVHDFASAKQAINIIIDQGEGTDTDPFYDDNEPNKEPAHYYRFAEIIKGYKLGKIEKPGNPTTYAYNGNQVKLDTNGVWNVAPDREGDNQAVITFNYTYTNLLKTLHGLFNGQNNQQHFYTALGLMMSLKQQAMEMMSILGVGPSFVYQPTNPSIPEKN